MLVRVYDQYQIIINDLQDRLLFTGGAVYVDREDCLVKEKELKGELEYLQKEAPTDTKEIQRVKARLHGNQKALTYVTMRDNVYFATNGNKILNSIYALFRASEQQRLSNIAAKYPRLWQGLTGRQHP